MLTALNTGHSASCGPWSPPLGIARSILAASTLLTLLFNDPDYLFHPLGRSIAESAPRGLSRLSLFAIMDAAPARWIAVILLMIVVSGWRPRLTGLLHWWVSASFAASAVIVEGGDQVCAILSLLLLPITFFDPRKWHWQRGPCATEESLTAFLSRSALFMIRLQVAVIYLVAVIGKFQVMEWVNGTVLYYWFTHPVFGVSGWREALAAPIITTWLVVPLTWGVLGVELLLGMGLVATARMQRIMFAIGVAFHMAIIVAHGLVTFGIAMIAALLLYLRTPRSCGDHRDREVAESPQTGLLQYEKKVA